MTALSQPEARERSKYRDLTGLARTSLVVGGLMMLATSGCLVTDRPEFSQPDRTRPVLSNLKPSPSKMGVIPQVQGAPPGTYAKDVTISFDVTSEDRQRPLNWVVLLDFPGFNQGSFGTILKKLDEIPVSELSTGPASRSLKLDIQPTVNQDCHSITVVVSHLFKGFSADPVDQQDVALATWWFQIGVDYSKDPDKWYAQCKADTPVIDAGVDAAAEAAP